MTQASDPEGSGKIVVELKGIDKRHLASVWQKMKEGDELAASEVYIGRSLADHPQWFPFFETIGILESGDDTLPDGSNPFAHVSMHVIIGSQIFHQNPPEAEVFYRTRLRKGDNRHAIIHMMIHVFQRHLVWAAQHATADGGAKFDMDAYGKTLRTLWPLKTPKLWERLGFRKPPRPHVDDRL